MQKLSHPVVVAEGLSKHYGPYIAVREIAFGILEGQVVALLGLNGAGKTTIMRMITGYLTPTEGSVRIADFDIRRDRISAAALIGYLPENGPLYFDMTPFELLLFFGEARGMLRSRLRQRIEVVADQCGVQSILNKPIGKLSKGLRQRVGMAQALLHDPPILVMDEPTSGLDPVQIRNFRDHVRELRGHKTILVSTHILPEAEAIADRVLIIHAGQLVFDGTSQELSAHSSLEERFYELTTSGSSQPPNDSRRDKHFFENRGLA